MVALLLAVLLEGTHEGGLVLGGLEPSVAELGAGVDELEIDLLKSPLLGVREERLPQGEGPLLGSNAAALHSRKLAKFLKSWKTIIATHCFSDI